MERMFCGFAYALLIILCCPKMQVHQIAPPIQPKLRKEGRRMNHNKVIRCFENVPYLKLLWSSLESQGCAPDLNRNFSCEICQDGSNIEHAGNYDHQKNQVI